MSDPSNGPHVIEAEQALLGAILYSNPVFERVMDELRPEHFFDPLHAALYEIIVIELSEGRSVSPVLMKPLVQHLPPITDDVTVQQYLGRLAGQAVPARAAFDCARSIISAAQRRTIYNVAEQMMHSARFSSEPADTLLEHAERLLYGIAVKSRESQVTAFSEAANEAVEAANKAYQRNGELVGLGTGLVDLDRMLGGLQGGNLIILAGRPSMGKSALALNIAFWVAQRYVRTEGREGAPVDFYSLEMTPKELAQRIIAEQSGIPGMKIRRGDVNESQMRHVIETSRALNQTPITIDATGGVSIAQLVARARRAKRKRNTGLLVVDYLQLMSGSGRENRVQDLTEITMGLKSLAKDLDIPIIALSQLSRQVEQRQDKRPQLSDLRESGSIEQDADAVMFVYREEYYVERERPSEADFEAYSEWQTRMVQCAGKGEIIIGKQRNGAVGIVPVAFDGALTKFANWAGART